MSFWRIFWLTVLFSEYIPEQIDRLRHWHCRSERIMFFSLSYIVPYWPSLFPMRSCKEFIFHFCILVRYPYLRFLPEDEVVSIPDHFKWMTTLLFAVNITHPGGIASVLLALELLFWWHYFPVCSSQESVPACLLSYKVSKIIRIFILVFNRKIELR